MFRFYSMTESRNPQTVNRIAENVIVVPLFYDPDAFLGFTRNKGVDFLARFNNKYVAGEAKFLTDFGGHQNAQFDDALSSLHSFRKSYDVIPVAILDGVLYIESRNKMHSYITSHPEDNILSALVLREFLYSL